MPAGRRVDCFSLCSSGITVNVLTLGAILQGVHVPDAAGTVANVTLSGTSVDDYLSQDAYLGAIVGRYANRIAGGCFELDGLVHRLSVNERPNTLHGGVEGFDRRVWSAIAFEKGTGAGVVLSLTSEDGDQGFPGTLDVQVRYFVIGSELRVDYRASTSRPTVVNLTNHAYWNLSGEGHGSIDDHILWLNTRRYTPIDQALIPTGAIEHVKGTPFDFFSRPEPIGRRLTLDDEQLRFGGGYDHNFVLEPRATGDGAPQPAARVVDPTSGRTLDVLTTAPALQFYSGNKLDGSTAGPSGRPYGRRSGFALETQLFPDAPHQPHFPSSILRPGEQFRTTTVYRFTTAAR
jgi:aldose 1-epimerase